MNHKLSNLPWKTKESSYGLQPDGLVDVINVIDNAGNKVTGNILDGQTLIDHEYIIAAVNLLPKLVKCLDNTIETLMNTGICLDKESAINDVLEEAKTALEKAGIEV